MPAVTGYALVLLSHTFPAGTATKKQPGTHYLSALRSPGITWLVTVNFLYALGGVSLLELLPLAVRLQAGVTTAGVGFVYVLNTIVVCGLQQPVGRRALAAGKRRSLAIGLGLASASWALMAGLPGGSGALACLGVIISLFAVSECICGAVFAPLLAERAPEGATGRTMALSSTAWMAGYSAGPALGGLFLARWPIGMWLFGGATVAAACILVLGRRRP